MEHDYRDVLLKAASIVEGGWTQGTTHRNADGLMVDAASAVKSCAIGALDISLGALFPDRFSNRQDPGRRAYLEVMSALRTAIGGPSISNWNDAPGRTADEVAEAMRRAAE